MSWLFIDSSTRDVVRLAFMPTKGRIRVQTIRRPRINVPAALSVFMDVAEVTRVDGVCVVTGPGSFSAVRAGVLAANMVARFSAKPLFAITVEEALSLPVLRARLASGEIASTSYAAPVYDQEPNITQARVSSALHST